MEHKSDRFGDDKEVRRLAEQIANERIAPDASERDLNHTFPWDAIRILAEAGILGVAVSKDHGGFGGGRAILSSVVQEISKACASTALILVSHVIAAKAIELAADKDVAKRWIQEMVKGRSLGAFAVH
jgi:alkylation response protein AidB-like acyl-CoA dehydrogenase